MELKNVECPRGCGYNPRLVSTVAQFNLEKHLKHDCILRPGVNGKVADDLPILAESGETGIKEIQRVEHTSGMIRDTTDGKINWSLVADGLLLKRWAIHLTKGALSKGKRNWTKAGDDPETAENDLERFREGAFRHFMQWYLGENDEDHAAATIFNMDGAELVKAKLERDD